MVVFTCNHCGESLQKAKVDKHYGSKCRRNQVHLTCVDCLKDFGLEEYVKHIKCVSEAERYAAKGKNVSFVKKGESKQAEFVELVRNIADTRSDLSPDVKHLLTTVRDNDNIPQKKQKFINFLKNTYRKQINVQAVEKAWEVIEEHKKKLNENASKNNENGTSEKELKDKINNKRKMESNQEEVEAKKHKLDEDANAGEVTEKKSKKKRKSEENGKHIEENGVNEKKSKKIHKNDNEIEGNDDKEEENGEKHVENGTVKKSKKKVKEIGGNDVKLEENGVAQIENDTKIEENNKNELFSLKDKMLDILIKKKSTSIEKLKKKVLNAYIKHLGLEEVTAKHIKKFNKCLSKLDNVKVEEENVTLIET